MKKNGFSTLIRAPFFFLLSFFIYSSVFSLTPKDDTTEVNKVHAVSLKGIQEQLKSHQDGTFPDDILQLGGLTSIMGYIVDEANHDLILFGQTNPDLPPLYLEDFVLALRNAWFKYAPLHGNVREYSYPGCSIDPNPQTIQKLRALGQRITQNTSFEEVEDELENWHRICHELQRVRVMGLPFDTHFAQVMVKADYDMKTLVDGSDSLDIPGFKSLVKLKVNEIRGAVVQNKHITVSRAGMNRFWFYPGTNLYEEDQDIVWITQCPVELLTEEMFVNAKEGFVSGGRVDPLAKKFAEDFSILYDKVAIERPIYTELENLFRFVALANIIKFKSAHIRAGLDLSYLLDDFPISNKLVDKNLPGRSAVYCLDFDNGDQISQLCLPSCGGVSIGIQTGATQFVRTTTEHLSSLRRELLTARPTEYIYKWRCLSADCRDEYIVDDFQNRIRLQKINQKSKNFFVATIKDADSKFETYTGPDFEKSEIKDTKSGYEVTSAGLNYKGNSIPELFDTIIEPMILKSRKTFYFDMKDFPSNDKIEAFKTTCQIQAAKRNLGIRIETLSRRNGSTEMQDLFFSHGIRFDIESSSIEPYEGGYRTSIPFSTKLRGKIRPIPVDVFTRTRERGQEFRTKVELYFSPRENESTDNVSEFINRIRQELQKSIDDFIIKIRDEVGNTEIVILVEPSAGEEGE